MDQYGTRSWPMRESPGSSHPRDVDSGMASPVARARDFRGWRDLPASLLIFAVGLIVVGALTAALVRYQYNSEMAAWHERQSSMADDYSRMLTEWLAERRSDAEILSTRPSVIETLSRRALGGDSKGSGRDIRTLTSTLEAYAKAYRYAGV